MGYFRWIDRGTNKLGKQCQTISVLTFNLGRRFVRGEGEGEGGGGRGRGRGGEGGGVKWD